MCHICVNNHKYYTYFKSHFCKVALVQVEHWKVIFIQNIASYNYWFQTTLYTRLIVNVTKRMKKYTFLRRYLAFLGEIIPLHPAPF